MPKILAPVGAALLVLMLSGCGFIASQLPGGSEPTPTTHGFSMQTEAPADAADSSSGGAADSGGADAADSQINVKTTAPDGPEQLYFDNVSIMRTIAVGSPDSLLPSSTALSWDEATEDSRKKTVEVGEKHCSDDAAMSGSAQVGSGAMDESVFLPWLAAKYLCPEHLDPVEKAFRAELGEDMFVALDEAALRKDANTEDVLMALGLCATALEMSWTLPDAWWTGGFCWTARVKTVAVSGQEMDFIDMFSGTEGETGEEFAKLAKEMGAEPGGVTGLVD